MHVIYLRYNKGDKSGPPPTKKKKGPISTFPKKENSSERVYLISVKRCLDILFPTFEESQVKKGRNTDISDIRRGSTTDQLNG